MKLTRYPDAGSFLSATEGFLYREEEANSLMLGIAVTLQNDPGHYGTIPWFAAVEGADTVIATALRTPPHFLLVSAGPSPAMEILVADAAKSSAPLTGVSGKTDSSLALASAWSRISGRSFRLKAADRIHKLAAVSPVPQATGRMRELADGEIPLYCSWLSQFMNEAGVLTDLRDKGELARARMAFHQAWVWDDGGPVAMASWGRETRNTGCIYGVYTPPEKRGKGYATSLVAGLSRYLLAGGKSACVLFTDLANPVSNSIYAKIGYTPVCDFNEYEFE